MAVPQYLFTQDYIAGNCYFDGTDWRYSATRDAYLIQLSAGVTIQYAPSGTAGTVITWGPAISLTSGFADINSGYGTIPGIGGAAGGPADLAIGGGGSNPNAISFGWGNGTGYALEFLSGLSGGTNIGSLTDQGVLSILHQIISGGWIGAQVSTPSDANTNQSFDAVDGKFSGNLGIGVGADHSGTFPLIVAGAIKCSGLTLTGSLSAAGIQDTLLTANKPVRSDGSKNLVSGDIDITSEVTATGLTAGNFLSWGGTGVTEIPLGASSIGYISGVTSGTLTYDFAVTSVSLVGAPPGLSLNVTTELFVTGFGLTAFNVEKGLVQ